jgi:endonuclease/exonuclease/phosphatase family metal-dependent hydrolase
MRQPKNFLKADLKSMQIYSWNLSDRNKTLDKALAFIKGIKFDVLCLQEVPEDFLGRLKKLPFSHVYHVDLQRFLPTGVRTDYLVILTPHQIVNSHTFFTSQGLQQPWRTRCFVYCMSRVKTLGWSEIDNHGGVYADIQVPGINSPLRVFSTHLRLDSPEERKREFTLISKHFNADGKNIVCGDFNIIDSPFLKPFSWLMGAHIKEALPWYPERALKEELFGQYQLKNPLKGKRTHILFSNQLDHILVPEYAPVTDTTALPDPVGSDHYPVMVTVEL